MDRRRPCSPIWSSVPARACARSSRTVAGFRPTPILRQWMHQHAVTPAATYVNWIGRTVLQIREDAALRAALIDHLQGIELDVPRPCARRVLHSAQGVRRRGAASRPPVADAGCADPIRVVAAQLAAQDRRAAGAPRAAAVPRAGLAAARAAAALARKVGPGDSRRGPIRSTCATWPRLKITTSPTSSAPSATSSQACSGAIQ